MSEMNMNADELALRELFQDLTAGQPPAPPGRYAAVRRRLVRHRWEQAAAWSAAIAVTGAAAAVVAVLPARPAVQPGSRPVPAWAVPWPDHRNGSVPQRVLDGAVTGWQHQWLLDKGTSPPAVRKLIWYVGQTAAAGEDVIVAFEADTASGRYLVAGSTIASEVMHGQPGWVASGNSSPWVLWTAPAPARSDGLAIGLNLSGPQTGTAGPDNWIMVLAAPDVRTVTWMAPTSSGPRPGSAAAERGLAIADTGPVTGRVMLTGLIARHRDVLGRPRNVGVPGSFVPPDTQGSDVPTLAQPAPLSLPPAYRSNAGISGQGNGGYTHSGQFVPRRPAVFARCYGPAPLRIYLGPDQGGRELGVIPCDNAEHELLGRAGSRPPNDLTVSTGFLTAWRADLGSVP
jgi:hypothetical protein